MRTRWRFAFVSLFVCVLAQFSSEASAHEFLITPETKISSVAKKVVAGDTIILQNGLWRDTEIKLDRLPGTADQPIQVRAQTPGKVVLSGKAQFRLSGQHVTVSGLVFRDCTDSDVFQLRSHSERHSHFCRVTDCMFEQTSKSKPGTESRWMNVYGTHNRVDHCYFAGKRSRGTTFVVWVDKDVEAHRIDHNHFGPRPELGRNGGETIRIGTSEVSELPCETTVEDNFFSKCNGESEIISNKSCGNVYRHNVFYECSGALTLRHGHRCVVDGNVFQGNGQRGTGGVRIIGSGHRVTNNCFQNLRGDAERAAICLMNGIPESPLNGYAPIRNAFVVHNTFVDCKVTFELGVGAGKKQSAAATNCTFMHNACSPGKWSLMRIHADAKNSVWKENLLCIGKKEQDEREGFDRVSFQLEQESNGLYRPVNADDLKSKTSSAIQVDIDGGTRGKDIVVGCDDPTNGEREFASPANTGPRSFGITKN